MYFLFYIYKETLKHFLDQVQVLYRLEILTFRGLGPAKRATRIVRIH